MTDVTPTFTPTPTSTSTDPSSTGSHLDATSGKTTINDAVVAKVAGIAASGVRGVHALGGGAARALGAIRGAMNNQDRSQGVSVEVGETQVAVDISLVAEYPVSLQQVADTVRSEVIEAIESLVGMQVTEVNVTINDVFIPSDDEDNKEEARVQ